MNRRKNYKRKRAFIVLGIITALAVVAGIVFYCSFFPNPFAKLVPSDQISTGVESVTGESDVLIAYFSLANNREYVSTAVDAVASASLKGYGEKAYGHAELLAVAAQETTGGDVFPIKVQDLYPETYGEALDRQHREMDIEYCPPLLGHLENTEMYKTVVLIYPCWLGSLPQPVKSFLREYGFVEHTIVPIATSQALGLGSGPEQIAELCPDAVIAEGLSARNEADVKDFLSDMGLGQ